jgi:hypothetical protein
MRKHDEHRENKKDDRDGASASTALLSLAFLPSCFAQNNLVNFICERPVKPLVN